MRDLQVKRILRLQIRIDCRILKTKTDLPFKTGPDFFQPAFVL